MFNEQLDKSISPTQVVDMLGLRSQTSSTGGLQTLCEQAVTELPAESDLVRNGNDKVLMKIVGRVMKLSKGTADAQAVRAALLELLRP